MGWGEGGRKERERERDRQTDRQTETDRDRERQRESKQKQRTQLQYLSIRERKTGKYSELKNSNIMIRQTGRQGGRQTDWCFKPSQPVQSYQGDRQTDTENSTPAILNIGERKRGKQTGRDTDR